MPTHRDVIACAECEWHNQKDCPYDREGSLCCPLVKSFIAPAASNGAAGGKDGGPTGSRLRVKYPTVAERQF